MKQSRVFGITAVGGLVLAGLMAGCHGKQAASGPAMKGLPVQTVTVSMSPVEQTSEYVATIKSRRSATLQPQVSGTLTGIRVRSGDHVRAGQVLFDIDSRQQQATVASLKATERQKKASYDYNATEQERQRKLFEAGVTSRSAYDQAQQSFQNTKADYEASVESRKSQEQVLAYYSVRAPFGGVIGDIPVHVGDFVSTATQLTTVDENKDLEAYIYIPTEHSADIHMGLGVNLIDNNGKPMESSKIDFISPQVDSTLQGILVKAPVHATPEMLRSAQLVKARVVWGTKTMSVVPVLAVARQGEQSFVFVVQQQNGMAVARRTSVKLGETIGNNYSIASGLNPGDRVIVSGIQTLVDGMPVILLGK